MRSVEVSFPPEKLRSGAGFSEGPGVTAVSAKKKSWLAKARI